MYNTSVDNSVEEIKKKLDIVDTISRYLPLKKRGRHWLANCPFHSEKTPSFTVSQELQIYKCFGCGKAGDIFNFVEEYEHIDFKEALEELAAIAGVVIKKDPRLSRAESVHKRLIDLNHQVAKFYHYILISHPLGSGALNYLTKRGISSSTIKLFRLGFSPNNPQLIVKFLSQKGFTPNELIATGTFGRSHYQSTQMYDRFQGRLIFPLTDYRDRVLGFSGRIFQDSLPAGRQAKYINSPETDIYHKSQMLFGLNLAKESIKKLNSVIVVEGEFDMISPFQAGIKNIVAIKGTAFTTDQLQLLRRYTDSLILGLDADFAGSSAAKKSIELADNLEFDIKVLSLGGKYKDPDEAVHSDPDFFRSQLSTPIPVWDFIISSAFNNFDANTVKGKKDILNMVLPFLVKINNSVIRNDYFNKLASQLGSGLESIREEAQKLTQPVDKSPTINTSTPSLADKISKIERLEEYLLTLIFSAKKPVLLSSKIASKIEFSIARFCHIFDALKNLSADFKPSQFAAKLPPELQPVYQDVFLASSLLTFDSQSRQIEIKKTVNQIQDITLRQKLIKLSAQIAQAENANQSSQIALLEQEYNQTLAKLAKIQATKS